MRKRIIQIILLVALILSGILSFKSIKSLQGNARVINYTGFVRGATQRLVKEELNGIQDDELISRIDGILDELENGGGNYDLIPLKDPEYQRLVRQMQEGWILLKDGIGSLRQGGSADVVYYLSETYFGIADETVAAAEQYSEESIGAAERVLLVLILIFVCTSGLLIWYDYFQDVRGRRLKEAEDENRKRSEHLLKMSQDLRAPLDDISELLYISDLENYDLLYLNEAAMKTYGVTELAGKKCYEVMQGTDSPCTFCNNNILKKGETYTWEKTNAVTKRHYLLKDRMIEWEGRPARIEIAFDMTRAEEEKKKLQHALDGEYMLMECVQLLYHGKELGTIVNSVLERMGKFLAAQRTCVFRVTHSGMYLEYEWCEDSGRPETVGRSEKPIPMPDRWKRYFSRGDCIIVDDLESLKNEWPEEYRILKEKGISRMVSAPMEQDGTLYGFIGVDNPPQEMLNKISPLLRTLAYFLVLTYGQFESEKELSRLSYHDTLTSFYNRNRYMEDLAGMCSDNSPAGVVYLDVNGLKDINDRDGHAAGDRILVRCAELMKAVFGEGTYYRIGGDEFVIISRKLLQEQFEEKISLLKNAFREDDACSASIGSAWKETLPDTAAASQLVADADARMYEDKKEFYRSRPNSRRYRHHSDELLELGKPEVLNEEIRKNHFIVYVQPKMSSDSRSAVGAEALIRYQPDNGALMLPGNFLSILEESKTISQLDFYVFDFVCSRIKEWIGQGKETFPVSVNFSRYSLIQPSFVEQLTETCKKHGVSPGYLGIEFTGDLKNMPDINLKSLVLRLRQAGFAIALDDFGMDSTDFSPLTSVELDVLKLDQSMIQDVADNPKTGAVVEAIAGICRKMDIKLVAEGIETEEQLEALKSCGVEMAQGYLFSRPLPVREYEEKYLKLKNRTDTDETGV